MRANLPESGSLSTLKWVGIRGYGVAPMPADRHVRLRALLAVNVQALLDRDVPSTRADRRGQIPAFLDKHKISRKRLSKFQRAVKDGAINLGALEELAQAFKVEPYQLLIDKLDVNDPQIAERPSVVAAARRIAGDLLSEGTQ